MCELLYKTVTVTKSQLDAGRWMLDADLDLAGDQSHKKSKVVHPIIQL